MAAGDWVTGTQASVLDARLSFENGVPVLVLVSYRIKLPSGEVLSEIRQLSFEPNQQTLQDMAPALGDVGQRIAAQEGLS